jgi:hypothetical protein
VPVIKPISDLRNKANQISDVVVENYLIFYVREEGTIFVHRIIHVRETTEDCYEPQAGDFGDGVAGRATRSDIRRWHVG